MDYLTKLRIALSVRSKGKAYIQGSLLVDKLTKDTKLQRDEIISGLQQLRDVSEISCRDWHRGEPIGQVQLNLIYQTTEAELNWRAVLMGHDLADTEIEALMGMADALTGWNKSDLENLLRGLVALRHDLPKLRGESRYHVSAKYLLASSKLLDALPTFSLRNFGIDPAVLTGPKSYIITAGPPDPECVVLVENPQAFEAALEAERGQRVAWIATFGYGLSRTGEEFGTQLANLIESSCRLTSLVRSGNPPPIETLLAHPTLYFWGDLDKEGLKIYWRLKSKIPQLQFSNLYAPMINMLKSTNSSHRYTRLVAKEGQRNWACYDTTVQELINQCAERAVDQEALTQEQIIKNACLKLDAEDD
jgi:hypothetical protein